MKKEVKIIVLTAMMMSFLGVNFVTAVEPTIGDITLSPSNPTSQSTVTFSVDVSGDNFSEVHIMVQECNENTGICYPDIQNVSMQKNAGHYETDVTLKHSDATYITYYVNIKKNDGAWISSAKPKLNLTENSSGNNNNGGDGNTGKKTPGFELVPFIIAIGFGVLFLKRKRLR